MVERQVYGQATWRSVACWVVFVWPIFEVHAHFLIENGETPVDGVLCLKG